MAAARPRCPGSIRGQGPASSQSLEAGASVVSCIQCPLPLPSIVNFVWLCLSPGPSSACLPPPLSLSHELALPAAACCLQWPAAANVTCHVTQDIQHFLPRCSSLLPHSQPVYRTLLSSRKWCKYLEIHPCSNWLR